MKDRIPQRQPELLLGNLYFNGSVFALRCQDLARSSVLVFSTNVARSRFMGFSQRVARSFYMVFSSVVARSQLMVYSGMLARSITLVSSVKMARSHSLAYSLILARSRGLGFSRKVAYIVSLHADDLNIPLDTAPLPATLQSCAMLHTGLSETS